MPESPEQFVFKPRQKRRPGLHSIARKLGVSHTAVSRALRGDLSLSEKLRQDVQAVAQQEGYVSSNIAQGLVSGWSGTIGVVLPTLASSFISTMANGIAEALWEDSTIPMMLCSDLQVDREEKMLAALAQKRVNGVIIMPSREDRGATHFCHLLARHTPIVAVDASLPRIDVPLVASDDERGAMEATQHLIERGHRHILHLAAAVDNAYSDRRREKGYRKAMKSAGLRAQVVHIPDRRFQTGQIVSLLEEHLTSAKGRKTTAVLAFNDPLAYCVYGAARRMGRTIGQDMAVIGFGNYRGTPISDTADVDAIRPSLSSVEQYPAKIGRMAVELLRKMMRSEAVPRQNLIEPMLIVRDSSGATGEVRR